MGNLINSIPVYKPQVIPAATNKPQAAPVPSTVTTPVRQAVPQVQGFSYVPAEPLSPSATAPRGIKPMKPAGHLVKENIFQSAGSTVKSYADYVKYFYKAAFKGEGTDYSVGKVNDLAIRTGSLGIAAVLASSKVFPFARGMEFVGLATWFASMAIWPRIIGTPIKMATGVDINQKYVDSYDRRKNFFEDPQYLPWDLYKHIDKKGKYNENSPEYEKLDAIGDKLGIPRDIPNRREAIQDKMKQIAIQGNTLWMLTAGVMTPVVSSIAADSLQEPIKTGLGKLRTHNAEKNIAKLNEKLDALLKKGNATLAETMSGLNFKPDAKVQSEFDAIFSHGGNGLTKDGLDGLEKFLSDRYFAKGVLIPIQKEMKHAMDVREPYVRVTGSFADDLMKITADAIQEVRDMVPEANRSKIPKNFLDYKGLKPHEISAALEESLVAFGQEEINMVQQGSVKNLLARKVVWTVNEQQNVDRSLLKALRETINNKTQKYFEQNHYFKVDKARMKHLFNFAETHVHLHDKIAELEKATVMNISESATAINWDRVPKKYLKSLGFTKAELAEVAGTDSRNAGKVVLKKFEEIAQNPEKFEKVLSKMTKLSAEAVSKEEKAVIQLIGTYEKPGVLSKVRTLMMRIAYQDNFHDKAKGALSMEYNAKIREVYQKLVNTTDSFARQIKAIDTIKNADARVEEILGHDINEFRQKLYNRAKFYMFKSPDGLNDEQLAKEYQRAKAGLSAYIKEIALHKNDINDWTTKFESKIPGYPKGIKHSKEMLWEIANTVNGSLDKKTVDAIMNGSKDEKEKLVASNFIDLINKNIEEMKFRFMGTDNKLLKHANEGEINKGIVKDFFEKNDFSKLPEIENRLKRRVHEITRETVDACLGRLHDYKNNFSGSETYNRKSAIDSILKEINYKVSNKALAAESGKNVTDFVSSAAQNVRSRNKWTKLAYGLLIGTTAFTAVALAFVGRKNYFNKDEYKNQNKSVPEGVNK